MKRTVAHVTITRHETVEIDVDALVKVGGKKMASDRSLREWAIGLSTGNGFISAVDVNIERVEDK